MHGEGEAGSGPGGVLMDQKAKLQEDLSRLRELSAQIRGLPQGGGGGGGGEGKAEMDWRLTEMKERLRMFGTQAQSPQAGQGSRHGTAGRGEGGAEKKGRLGSQRGLVQEDLERLRRQLECVRSPMSRAGGDASVDSTPLSLEEGEGRGRGGGEETKAEGGCKEERVVKVQAKEGGSEGGSEGSGSWSSRQAGTGPGAGVVSGLSEVEGLGMLLRRDSGQDPDALRMDTMMLTVAGQVLVDREEKGPSETGSALQSSAETTDSRSKLRSNSVPRRNPVESPPMGSPVSATSNCSSSGILLSEGGPGECNVLTRVNSSVVAISFHEYAGKDALRTLSFDTLEADMDAESMSAPRHGEGAGTRSGSTTLTRRVGEHDDEPSIEGLGLIKGWLVAGPCGLFYGIRQLVSGQKYRFQEDGFDLDLTYVTSSVIAMAYPAEKTLVERASRNHIDEVLTFFKSKHSGKCKIFNLIRETNIARYDLQRFKNEGFPVTREYSFYDHSVPPVDILIDAVEEMNEWIEGADGRVAAVHCKAGKGRTGLVVCCYLADKFDMTANEAMVEYGVKRMKDGLGLTVPSQRRWVQYYVARNIPLRLNNLLIKEVSFKEGIFGNKYGQYKLMIHVHQSAINIVDGEIKKTWALRMAFCSEVVRPNKRGDVIFNSWANKDVMSLQGTEEEGRGEGEGERKKDSASAKEGTGNEGEDRTDSGLVVDGGFCVTICMNPRGKFVHGPSCWLHARHLPEAVYLTTKEWDRVTQGGGIRERDIHPKTSSIASAWEVKIVSESTESTKIPILGQTLQ